jgi:hypothetical protein
MDFIPTGLQYNAFEGVSRDGCVILCKNEAFMGEEFQVTSVWCALKYFLL